MASGIAAEGLLGIGSETCRICTRGTSDAGHARFIAALTTRFAGGCRIAHIAQVARRAHGAHGRHIEVTGKADRRGVLALPGVAGPAWMQGWTRNPDAAVISRVG